MGWDGGWGVGESVSQNYKTLNPKETMPKDSAKSFLKRSEFTRNLQITKNFQKRN